MNKNSNESYKRIISYLKNNPQIDNSKKKELLQYASNLLLYNVENVEKVEIEHIINDLKIYRQYINKCEDTIFTRKRIDRIYEILELYDNYCNNKFDDLELISEKLDMLFLESDLGIRKGSNLSYVLTKKMIKDYCNSSLEKRNER